jgi:hypothetical protein
MNTTQAKADLAKSKVWNDRTWYFCSKETGGKCEGKWRCHLPTKCQGKEFKYPSKNPAPKGDDDGNDNQSKKKLKLAAGFQAVVEEYKHHQIEDDEESVFITNMENESYSDNEYEYDEGQK